MPLWQQLLACLLMAAVLFLFLPGVRQSLRESREAKNPDWKGALIPIGLVILFIIFLVALVRSPTPTSSPVYSDDTLISTRSAVHIFY